MSGMLSVRRAVVIVRGLFIFGLGFLRARLLQLYCTAVFPPIFLQLRKGLL